MSHNEPAGPPPAYESAIGQAQPQQQQAQGQAAQQPSAASTSTGAGHQPHRHNSSSEEVDIEQEDRPLPPGWVPQYDEQHDRFFFVDTNANPPRSIWIHPLDDQEWLSTVPHGTEPMAWIEKLWNDQPMPSPAPAHKSLPNQPQRTTSHVGTSSSQQQEQPLRLSDLGRPGPNGKRVVSLEDLTQYYLSKMGSPEEYERKNPPNKASKMFHSKETARQRQRRHAEAKARDLADNLSYRSPAMPPPMMYGRPMGGAMMGPGMYGRGYGGYGGGYGYGYPGYGRGYGQRYPGYGMSGAFLGLGAGALLGGALF